jgi:hypothetical protein
LHTVPSGLGKVNSLPVSGNGDHIGYTKVFPIN